MAAENRYIFLLVALVAKFSSGDSPSILRIIKCEIDWAVAKKIVYETYSTYIFSEKDKLICRMGEYEPIIGFRKLFQILEKF